MTTDRIVQIILAALAAGGLTFGTNQASDQAETISVLTELAGNYSQELEELKEECDVE